MQLAFPLARPRTRTLVRTEGLGGSRDWEEYYVRDFCEQKLPRLFSHAWTPRDISSILSLLATYPAAANAVREELKAHGLCGANAREMELKIW